ncbi:MAG TPA: sulfite exporter TauE/SafE family protein [Phycisphaerae bacterium]|nr:sulfite exporter TauE/SafE family protein [Phycisphaerae bacterium]
MLHSLNIAEFTAVVWVVSLIAGFLGSLTGLGGGVVIIPVLSLILGVDIRYAIGASLVSVIATSSGAAAAYVREGFTNIRIGMFLEIATTLGALAGASVAVVMPAPAIAVIFGVVLIHSAYLSSRARHERTGDQPPDPLATRLKMNGTYPTPGSPERYHVRHVPGGFALMFVAGALSGLLGIGSGAVKVLAMDQIMRIPFKVSTTTSNFMIGVTAAASAGVYLRRGYIDPGLAMPVMLGVLAGSLIGARVLVGARTRVLRAVFGLVILLLGIEMIYNGLTGRI